MMACQSKGIERLGILRMDVDDMGRIIGEGLGENATFSRLATLSFMVNFFFEGWAAGLARRHNRPDSSTDRVYSIYSGGDDLFYVGSWDAMPELAERIRSDLFDFSAEHPGVHASSGIELSGSKYPLYQAADDAHQALEQSKGRPGKNAITFLGQTMPWEVFVTSVRPMADKLRELVEQEEEGIPAAVLQRLQRFQSDFQDAQAGLKDRGQGVNLLGQEQVFYGPWLWRAVYYLKRQERRAKGTGKEEIKQIRKQLHKGHFRAIEWIGLAARWADLRRRGSS
jgi:CRISPR-associated protein Csm1